jgi:predicted esterase
MSLERWFEATVHGRVLFGGADTAGSAAVPQPGRADWWIGFHGYGESAEHSLAALATLDVGEVRRIAFDALSAFYTKQGEVVGCWMTRRGREWAIGDNVGYVGGALRVLANEAGGWPARLTAVGFSQGTAMAYRAAVATAAEAPSRVRLIALAGDVPPEIGAESLGRLARVLIGRGDQETWYGEDKLAEDEARLRAAGVEVSVCRFTGGHEWTDEFRSAVRAWACQPDPPAGPLIGRSDDRMIRW